MSTDPNIISLTSSYQDESDFYKYNIDTATTSIGSSVTKDITRRNVQLDSTSGSWTDTKNTDTDVFSTAPDLRNKYHGEEDRRLSSYKGILKPLDQEILDINTEINDKKSQILSIYASAVGAGCTIGITTTIVNGVAIGIGSTVYQDLAQIKQYTNLYDSDSNDPFELDEQVNLTSSNLTLGYKNVNINNAGSIVGTYNSVGSWLGSDITMTPAAPCIGYVNQINTLATEISQLRIDRQVNVGKINDLKGSKLDDEISSWAYAREDKAVKKRKKDITGIITTLNQY